MKENEIETLALAVHGALAALHLLGAIYNARRGNRLDTIVHCLALAYDANAVRVHASRL